MSTESTAEFTHPGPILRAARDELRLSIEHVAERLHLRPSVVALIESETYDDFSSDVFLKGYFRSYCRLVGLHEERMVELLERQLEAIQEEQRQQKKAEAEAQASEKRIHMFKLGLVVSSILAVCGAVIWLLVGSPTHNGGEAATSAMPAEQVAEEAGEKGTAEITEAVVNDEDDMAAVEDQNIEAEAMLSEEDEAVLLQEKAPAAALVGNAASAVEDEAPTAVSENNAELPLTLESASVAILFTGECWFEAYDANGERITADLKKDGSRFDYEGPKPIRLVLGDGNVASVMVNEAAFDISSQIRRSGRAEVVIE